MTGNCLEAEDITQDVFLKVYRNLPRFNPDKKFFTWIYTICLNTVRSRLKKLKGFAEEGGGYKETAGTGPGPEGDLIEAQKLKSLEECFQRLPDVLRETIALKYYQGLSFQEVSEILGITESAAKMRVYRGLEMLKRLIEEKNRTS